MNLSPMRFKGYVWPHNPRVYEIAFRRDVCAHKVPFGLYVLQGMGRENRVLRGEGEFCGAGAYDEFRKLATVFCDDSPGVLVHPVWQAARAWFVELSLRQEPTEDFVAYSFEFWECWDGYAAPAETSADAALPAYHVARTGETLWSIARTYGLTAARLIALNPQLRTPNEVRAGDRIRLR